MDTNEDRLEKEDQATELATNSRTPIPREVEHEVEELKRRELSDDTPRDGRPVTSSRNALSAGGLNQSLTSSRDAKLYPDFSPEDEEEQKPIVTVTVPRLDDLIIKALAENYHICPAFDRIPAEYLDNVVALLDPSQIEFTVAATYITAEKFWRRLCKERWQICETGEHGQSYKRMYVERHLQQLLESYHPSKDLQNYHRLLKQVNASGPFVQTVKIQQLLSHLDLSLILHDFPNLCSLHLQYGARKLGMDYDKILFGMQIPDASSLAKLFSRTRTLNRITLSDNLINDDVLNVLLSGLAKNQTLTCIDLSHNKITDRGAKQLTQLLDNSGVLISLNLGDNNIGTEGAAHLARALADNFTLQELSLRVNPLGDLGAGAILSALRQNSSLTSCDLSCTGAQTKAAKEACDVLASNKSLRSLDLSCNEVAINGGVALLEALQRSSRLVSLDLRKTGLGEDVAKDVKAVLAQRSAVYNREKRQAFQQGGWDEAM